MASITTSATGRVTVQFVHPQDRKRRSIRAGKMSERDAQALKLKVEALVAAIASGLPLDQGTQLWVKGIGDGLRDKLAAVGLIDGMKTPAGLQAYLADYIAGRTDLEP